MTDHTPTMETRPLGQRSGLHASAMGLGLWAVPGGEWGPAEDTGTLEAIEVALDAGVTFFDTADIYADGHSEVLLGQAMRGRRDQFLVATKVGWDGFDRERFRSRYDTVESLVESVEGSLRRLGTDRVELIQCHINEPEPNTDVFIEGFRRLKDAGKVLAWGVSTSDFAHLRHFNADGDCDALQIDYSILNRTPEEEILPYCAEHGIGVIVRGPLAMGLLADKFAATDTFPDDDFRSSWITDAEQHAQFLADLDTVAGLRGAVPDGGTMAAMALRFVLAQPAVTTVIPGARNARQARANTSPSARSPLTEAERAAIDAAVPPAGGRKIWPA